MSAKRWCSQWISGGKWVLQTRNKSEVKLSSLANSTQSSEKVKEFKRKKETMFWGRRHASSQPHMIYSFDYLYSALRGNTPIFGWLVGK